MVAVMYASAFADKASIPDSTPGEVPAGLNAALRSAFSDLGIGWTVRDAGAQGDRILVEIPSEVSRGVIADILPSRLIAALRRTVDTTPQINVHLFLLLQADGHASSMPAATALRIMDAAERSAALWRSGDVLDVVVTDEFHREIAVEQEAYERVELPVDDRATPLWVRRPEATDALSQSEDQSSGRRAVHRLLARHDPGDPSLPEHWVRYRELFVHAQASGLVRSDDELGRALLINLMWYLYYSGEHRQAADLAAEAWESCWARNDETDPQSLEVASSRGLFLWALGSFADAAAVNQKTLEMRRRVSGDSASETILARLRVAVDTRTKGYFRAARDENRTIHAEASKLFGADSPIVLQSTHDLAVVTRLCGDYRGALDLNTTAWQLRDVRLGPDSSDTLNTRSGIFVDRRELGEYQEALDGHRQVAGRLAILAGENARGTLMRQAHLAVAMRKAGDYSGALDLSRRTYDQMSEVFGANHHVTLACAVGYATDLRYSELISEAREVGERARTGYIETLPAGHPLTLTANANHAVTLRLQEDFGGALRLNEQTLELFTQSLGATHPHAIACALNLASDLAGLREYDRAVARGRAEYERAREALGADHPTTLAGGLNLALDQSELGEDTSSRYAELLDRYRTKLGTGHPAVQVAEEKRRRANFDLDPLPL